MKKVITTMELQQQTGSELSALFRKVSQDLVQSEPGSPERRNTLASLENINRAINTRQTLQLKPPGF